MRRSAVDLRQAGEHRGAGVADAVEFDEQGDAAREGADFHVSLGRQGLGRQGLGRQGLGLDHRRIVHLARKASSDQAAAAGQSLERFGDSGVG